MILRGFEADGPRTSGFFKLQKIRTGKIIYFEIFLLIDNTNAMQNLAQFYPDTL